MAEEEGQTPTPPVTPDPNTPADGQTTLLVTPEPTSVTPPVDPKVTPDPTSQTTLPVTPVTPPVVAETPPVTPAVSDEQIKTITKDITKNVEGTVSKSVIQKISDALGLTKKEEEILPTDAGELKKMIDSGIKKGLEVVKTEQQEEQDKGNEQHQQKIDDVVRGWHGQYEQLVRLNKMPAIVDIKNDNDPGVIARRKMMLAIGEMIKVNKGKGIDYVPTMSDVFVGNPNVLNPPPGADLPIAGNTGSVPQDNFENKDIRSNSMESIAAGAIKTS